MMGADHSECHVESLLEALLEPVSVSVFLNDHWGSGAVAIRGAQTKFSFLLSPARLWEGVSATKIEHAEPLGPRREFKIHGSLDGGRTHFLVRPDDAATLSAGGAVLVWEGADVICDELASALAQIRREIYFLGDTTFRVRTLPEQGRYAMRYDSSAALVLLIQGNCEWAYSREIARDWPETDRTALELDSLPEPSDLTPINRPDDCSFETAKLSTGDALWLPAGCWYEISSGQGVTALELIFTSGGGFYGSFEPALKHMLQTMVGWRTPVPPLPVDQLDPTRAPANIHAIYQARLQELATTLDLFRQQPGIVDQAWSSLVISFSAPRIAPRECLGIHEGFSDTRRLQLALSGV